VVEPQVFGRGTGVTPIAVIGSTIFWTWLWGPLGLLIAMPITVCLNVLGRHVEGLHFLNVLLGDQPALTPEESFYQRALTGDAAEATYQAELALRDESLMSYLGEVALGGLKLAERDAARGALSAELMERIATTVSEMLENLADFEPRRWFGKFRRQPEKNGEGTSEGLASLDAPAEEDADENHVVPRDALASGWVVDTPILVIGGRSMLDEAAAALLAAVLAKRGLGAKAFPPEEISAGHITTLTGTEAKAVCLSYLGLGTGPAHIRYLVRRLRRILPKGTLILVAYWSDEHDRASVKALLDTAEADAYATTLREAEEILVEAAKGKIFGTVTAKAGAKPKPEPKGKKAPAPAA
jgi:AI-2E family transporter